VRNYSYDANIENWIQKGNIGLLRQMIAEDQKLRPSSAYVLSHPIFWSDSKQLNFVADVCKVFEDFDSGDVWKVKTELNGNFALIAENCNLQEDGWMGLVCPVVQYYLKNNGVSHYSGDKITDLYRAIYNLEKHAHNAKLPQNVKKELGQNHMHYWLPRFPLLISILWSVCESLNVPEYNFEISKYYNQK